MLRFAKIMLLLSFVATAAVAQNELPQAIELPPELDRVLRDYEQGWRNSDAASLAGLFTPDGFILRPRDQPRRAGGDGCTAGPVAGTTA